MPFGNSACKTVTMDVYNRDGDSPDVTPPANIQLCDAVNVVHFGGASATRSTSGLVDARDIVPQEHQVTPLTRMARRTWI